jgi:hypothetical protein
MTIHIMGPGYEIFLTLSRPAKYVAVAMSLILMIITGLNMRFR